MNTWVFVAFTLVALCSQAGKHCDEQRGGAGMQQLATAPVCAFAGIQGKVELRKPHGLQMPQLALLATADHALRRNDRVLRTELVGSTRFSSVWCSASLGRAPPAA